MKTGFARAKVTPWNGINISGYYETRTVKGVLDDLYVSAVAFDDGEKKAVIVTADVLMLSKEQCNIHKAEISRRTGIAPEAIFINCSHTHTGPFLNGERFGDDFDARYKPKMRPFLIKDYIHKTTTGYRLTRRGMLISNYILSEILEF